MIANNPKFAYFPGVFLNDVKKAAYNKFLRKVFHGEYKLIEIIRCYCGSDRLEILSSEDRFGLPFGTKICQDCGLISLSPRLCKDSLNDFYEEIYWGLILGGARRQELETVGCQKGSHIFEFIKDNIEFSDKKSLDIGEIGCGSGTKLIQLQKQCSLKGAVVSCYGCDYSSEAVRLAKNKGLFVNQGGVESLEGRKFDILILSHVVEHFVNIKDELEKIKMIIKNDGIVYVEVPGVCDLENKKEYLYNYNIYSVLAHMHNFNLTSLRFVMESNGFELIKGNEYVKSLFKMVSDDYKKVDVTQNYKNTMECLERAIDKHIQIEKSPVRVGKRFVRRIAKSFIS